MRLLLFLEIVIAAITLAFHKSFCFPGGSPEKTIDLSENTFFWWCLIVGIFMGLMNAYMFSWECTVYRGDRCDSKNRLFFSFTIPISVAAVSATIALGFPVARTLLMVVLIIALVIAAFAVGVKFNSVGNMNGLIVFASMMIESLSVGLAIGLKSQTPVIIGGALLTSLLLAAIAHPRSFEGLNIFYEDRPEHSFSDMYSSYDDSDPY